MPDTLRRCSSKETTTEPVSMACAASQTSLTGIGVPALWIHPAQIGGGLLEITKLLLRPTAKEIREILAVVLGVLIHSDAKYGAQDTEMPATGWHTIRKHRS